MDWPAPLVSAPKKYGSLRFWFHWRMLNAGIVPVSSRSPRVNECIVLLRNALIFSTIDANQGFLQVVSDPADRDKTAFNSHHWLLISSRRRIVLSRSCDTFQQLMDVIIFLTKWELSLLYLHDITIFSWNEDEHISHFRIILSLLHNPCITLNLKKYNLFPEIIDYLGHIIQPGELELRDHNTDANHVLKPLYNELSWSFSLEHAMYTGSTP